MGCMGFINNGKFLIDTAKSQVSLMPIHTIGLNVSKAKMTYSHQSRRHTLIQ